MSAHPILSIPTPPELMTAAERAGFRMACQAMRQHGARIERSAAALAPDLRADLLAGCGKMVRIVADLTEATLTGTAPRPRLN